MKPLCIYHHNCADGFGAAWVFHAYGGREFDFHPGVYGEDPPDCTGREVFLVDFSYKRAVVEDICREASDVVLIDHHKTAIEDLAPLIESRRIVALTSLEHSGAVLAWQWFHGHHDGDMPPLLRYIEDRDLWRFALPRSREINAALFSYPYEFEVWDRLMLEMPMDAMAIAGGAIERKHFKDIREFLVSGTMFMRLGGYVVPVANLPYFFSSDAGHELSNGCPFAACYWATGAGWRFSLRSQPDGVDVSMIATQYGGGGHAHAAGFTVGHGQLPQLIPGISEGVCGGPA